MTVASLVAGRGQPRRSDFAQGRPGHLQPARARACRCSSTPRSTTRFKRTKADAAPPTTCSGRLAVQHLQAHRAAAGADRLARARRRSRRRCHPTARAVAVLRHDRPERARPSSPTTTQEFLKYKAEVPEYCRTQRRAEPGAPLRRPRVADRPLALAGAAPGGVRRARAGLDLRGASRSTEATLPASSAGLDASWRGLSLTMPLKRPCSRCCDELSDHAGQAGARQHRGAPRRPPDRAQHRRARDRGGAARALRRSGRPGRRARRRSDGRLGRCWGSADLGCRHGRRCVVRDEARAAATVAAGGADTRGRPAGRAVGGRAGDGLGAPTCWSPPSRRRRRPAGRAGRSPSG